MRIIGTTEVSFEIERMLNSTNTFLILVAPYLKLNDRLKVRLSDAFKKVDDVFIFHRDKELRIKESQWLKSFNHITLFPIKNLHSKIYANENTVIISSMNLYEYSQINNHEIGVKLDALDDTVAYKDSLNEIRIILESEYTKHAKNFIEVTGLSNTYTMGELYNELNKKYTFKNYKNNSLVLYEYISDKSRKLVKFDNEELYKDKSAILRGTALGLERYNILKKELIKLSNNQ